ncbi:hypothetical protein [Nannocystis punicea]|uniref:Lipoprotein n=1 Tax=Nannocystis punicea TaxID=2995304 RepID=A0ABY7H2K5_9BACT|nr:hypothetical protein [Nannocystis poenicansa]WAS93494.1 hypothetical protein O0S08_45755 [Nannocystis poenicansa]
MRRTLSVLLSFAAACAARPVEDGTEAGSSTTSTTSTTAVTTTLEGTTAETPTTGESTTEAPQPCLEHNYTGGAPGAWMLTCGLPELCGGDEPLTFFTTSPDALAPGEVEVDDLERARCMAAALRDRTLGQITWWHVVDVQVVSAPVSLEIVLHTAFVRSVAGSTLLEQDDTYEGIYDLRPPEFFADCAEGDALAVWLCLVDAIEPQCLPGPLGCPK